MLKTYLLNGRKDYPYKSLTVSDVAFPEQPTRYTHRAHMWIL